MIATISGYAVPVLLAPLAIVLLRPLFARFFREGASLFLNLDLETNPAQLVGNTMAKINVVLFVLVWVGVFTCNTLELPVSLMASIIISGLLIGIWLTTGIARNALNVGGWDSAQVGLLSYAGGNLPMIILTAVVLAVW